MTNISMANISAYLLSVIFFINNIVLSVSLHIHDNRNTITRLLLGCSSDSKCWSFVGGGRRLLGLARGLEVKGRVWNWVWFLKELREFSSIPNE